MTDPAKLDRLFCEAVAAIDAGDVGALDRILVAHPELVRDRLESPGAWLRDKVGRAVDSGGFFERPYLLWFVAEDPVRNNRLPRNIADVARHIIRAAQRERVPSLQEQLDYAVRLVAWSWVARESGVQIELIDALVDAGASPSVDHDALVNRNVDAARRLVERGAPLTLATALCLSQWDDAQRLAATATPREKQIALVLAALNGNAKALQMLVGFGADIDAYSTAIYEHATPLHHAVCSASLEAVKVLVEAGAALGTKDTAHHATPLGWAEHYLSLGRDDDRSRQYLEIAAYIRSKGGPS